MTSSLTHTPNERPVEAQIEEHWQTHVFRIIVGISSIATPTALTVLAVFFKLYFGNLADEKIRPIAEAQKLLLDINRYEKDRSEMLQSRLNEQQALQKQLSDMSNTDRETRERIERNYVEILTKLNEINVALAGLKQQQK